MSYEAPETVPDLVKRSTERLARWVRDELSSIATAAAERLTGLVLYSAQTAEPYANFFIRFREPDGTSKAVVGFTAERDNTFSITSYEDFRLKFRTGKPGDTSAFLNRVSMHGSATESWLTIVSANTATEVGGCYIRFTESDDSIAKGYVGYASTTDDDLDIYNTISGSNIALTVTGSGYVVPNVPITFPVGSSGAPTVTFQGDTDTGFYHPAANTLTLCIGADRMTWTTASVTVNLQILGQDASAAAPAYSFTNDPDTGFYREGSNKFAAVTAGAGMMQFKAGGQVRFVPLASAPVTDVEDGDVYYDSGTGKLRVRAGGAWVDLH